VDLREPPFSESQRGFAEEGGILDRGIDQLLDGENIPPLVEYPTERDEKSALQGVGSEGPKVGVLVVFLENLRVVARDVVYFPVAAVVLDRRFDVASHGVKYAPIFVFR